MTEKKKDRIGQVCLEKDEDGQFVVGSKPSYDCATLNKHVMLVAASMKLEVPKSAVRVWATLYSSPRSNRIPLQVRMVGASSDEGSYPSIFHGDTELFSYCDCDARLRKWVGKPVYLEVEYLEA